MVDEEADEASAVEPGMGVSVEGAPLARVASRLTWPQEKSSILNKEGDAVIRMPGGPQGLEDVLAEADETYFDIRQAPVGDVFDVAGRGSIQTD